MSDATSSASVSSLSGGSTQTKCSAFLPDTLGVMCHFLYVLVRHSNKNKSKNKRGQAHIPCFRLQMVVPQRFFRLFPVVALLAVGAWSLCVQAEPIVRLVPAAFSKLPSAVRTGLVRNGCTVPQSFLANGPENAIFGSFTRIGAREWAVLCSVNGVSSILIFNARYQEPVSRIAECSDDTYVQVIGEGLTGFSRRISAVSAPTFGLTAIDDAFLDKASTVWVRSGRIWLETPGAD